MKVLPGWLDVPQALGRGNSTAWFSAKCTGLRALHARVRQGPLPRASGLPCPLLGMLVGAVLLASLPAKSSSEGEKKVLTLKQTVLGFLTLLDALLVGGTLVLQVQKSNCCTK